MIGPGDFDPPEDPVEEELPWGYEFFDPTDDVLADIDPDEAIQDAENKWEHERDSRYDK